MFPGLPCFSPLFRFYYTEHKPKNKNVEGLWSITVGDNHSINSACTLTLRQLLVSVHPESANIKNILTRPHVSVTTFKTPDAALYAYTEFMMGKIQNSRCSTLKNYSSMDECWLDSLWTCCLDGTLATSAIITSSNSTLCIPSKIKFVLQTQVSSHDMCKTCARHVHDMC